MCRSVMEAHLRLLLEKVDDVHQEAYKMNKWTMQVSKQQQEKSKYIHQRVRTEENGSITITTTTSNYYLYNRDSTE